MLSLKMATKMMNLRYINMCKHYKVLKTFKKRPKEKLEIIRCG